MKDIFESMYMIYNELNVSILITIYKFLRQEFKLCKGKKIQKKRKKKKKSKKKVKGRKKK